MAAAPPGQRCPPYVGTARACLDGQIWKGAKQCVAAHVYGHWRMAPGQAASRCTAKRRTVRDPYQLPTTNYLYLAPSKARCAEPQGPKQRIGSIHTHMQAIYLVLLTSSPKLLAALHRVLRALCCCHAPNCQLRRHPPVQVR